MNLHFVIFQVYILLYYFGERELNFIIKILLYMKKNLIFLEEYKNNNIGKQIHKNENYIHG